VVEKSFSTSTALKDEEKGKARRGSTFIL